MKINPEVLLEFCNTDRQKEIINALISQGTAIKAAKYLGINRRSVYRTTERLEKRAASQGRSPTPRLSASNCCRVRCQTNIHSL